MRFVPALFFIATAYAQFTSSTQLVVETVSVKDKSGKPVEGLTAKDFVLTEDGVAQTIKFFEYQKFDETPEPLPPPDGSRVRVVDKLAHMQIAPEQAGKTRYRDRRLLALYFDMTAMPPPDQLRALTAAEKFIKAQMTGADQMAILRFSGGSVDVLSDFTSDRAKLLTVIETLSVGEGSGNDESTNDDSTADTGAAFGQDDSEFNIFNTDRQLSALQTAAKMLGHLSEKKALIYFASGLRLNGVDNQAQLHATINAAIRAGVSFWPIDARGLVATAPLGDATTGSPGGIGMYNGNSALAVANHFQASQDTLWALAGDTGGKALLDFNDLTKGIRQAQDSFTSYYILGYYTTNEALNGKFRRIKISLAANEQAKLEYRQGYFSNKTFSKFTTADKERQLEDALMLGDPITELTIAMEINYFQLNRAEYFVPVAVKIPGRELALARKGGADHTLIDFIGEVKDEFGTTMSNVRDKVDIKLSGETAAQLSKRPIQYATGFTLLPGKYVMKFLARDSETGRIGTYQSTFVIPNLNKETQKIAISSVVLSSQKVDRKDAIYSVKKDIAEAVNPLVQDGQTLIPSVTRVFSRAREIYVYLQAYEPATTAVQPVVAFLTLYRGDAKIFESAPVQAKNETGSKLRTVPVRFTVPLDSLASGEYTCQITVLNPEGQKAAFWRSAVMLVP